MHFVDDVNLPPSGAAEGHPREQVPHLVDTPVCSRVELLHVQRRAGADSLTGLTCPAGLPLLRVFAIEGHRQDPSRARLACAPRTAEKVGVRDLRVSHRRSKHPCHVLLADDVHETLWPEPPIERLIWNLCISHDVEPRRYSATRSSERTAQGEGILQSPVAVGRPVRRSGDLRHTRHSAESCCRQALTRFTVRRCAGPDRRTRRPFCSRHVSLAGS